MRWVLAHKYPAEVKEGEIHTTKSARLKDFHLLRHDVKGLRLLTYLKHCPIFRAQVDLTIIIFVYSIIHSFIHSFRCLRFWVQKKDSILHRIKDTLKHNERSKFKKKIWKKWEKYVFVSYKVYQYLHSRDV